MWGHKKKKERENILGGEYFGDHNNLVPTFTVAGVLASTVVQEAEKRLMMTSRTGGEGSTSPTRHRLHHNSGRNHNSADRNFSNSPERNRSLMVNKRRSRSPLKEFDALFPSLEDAQKQKFKKRGSSNDESRDGGVQFRDGGDESSFKLLGGYDPSPMGDLSAPATPREEESVDGMKACSNPLFQIAEETEFPSLMKKAHDNSVEIESRVREDHGELASDSLNLPAMKPVLPPRNLNSRASTKPLYSSIVDRRNDLPRFTNDFPVVSGVVQASIPDNVLEDAQPLWTELIVGRFQTKAPRFNTVHFTVNKIWLLGDKEAKIEVFKINERLYKFRICSDSARNYILRRGMWNIGGQPMVVSKWSPIEESSDSGFRVLPMWVQLKDVPRKLFTRKGLGWLAGAAGEGKYLHPDTLQCKSFEEAKVFVEVNLQKELVTEFIVEGYEKPVQFKYPWLPKRCSLCSQWGHVSAKCVNPVDEVGVLRKEASGNRGASGDTHNSDDQELLKTGDREGVVDKSDDIEDGEIRAEASARKILDEVVTEIAEEMVDGINNERDDDLVNMDSHVGDAPEKERLNGSVVEKDQCSLNKSYEELIMDHKKLLKEASVVSDDQGFIKVSEAVASVDKDEGWIGVHSPSKRSRHQNVTLRQVDGIEVASRYQILADLNDDEIGPEIDVVRANTFSKVYKRTTRSSSRKASSEVSTKQNGRTK